MTHKIGWMKNYVFMILFFYLLSACSRDNISIPDTGRKIVINGLITTDTIINSLITRSNYLLDIDGTSYYNMIDYDSLEVVFYENNVKIDSLNHVRYSGFDPWKVFNFGNYVSEYNSPVSGKKYKITAKGQGLPNASASTVIPDMVSIEDVDTSRIILPPGKYYSFDTGLLCRIGFSDPPEKKNFYLLRITLKSYRKSVNNNSIPANYQDMEFFCSDPIVEEKLNTREGIQAVAFSDNHINGQKHNIELVIKGELIGEPIIKLEYPFSSTDIYRKTLNIKLYSITEEFFRYIQTLQLYSRNYSNPLAEPVLMESNVTGGYGMFSGASVATYSIEFNLF